MARHAVREERPASVAAHAWTAVAMPRVNLDDARSQQGLAATGLPYLIAMTQQSIRIYLKTHRRTGRTLHGLLRRSFAPCKL